MKTKLHILFTLGITILFVTCKKYPEDKRYSLKSVCKRNVGTYVLDKYIVNGIDSTSLIPPCVPIQSIQHGVYDGQYYYRLDAKNGINGMDGKGYFNLINNYNDFRTDYNYVAVGKNILKQTPKGIESVWHILRLDGKTLWIKQDFNNLTYEVHLKKIHS